MVLYTFFSLFLEDSNKETEMLKKFRDFQQKAEMYYVYHAIQRYTVSTKTKQNFENFCSSSSIIVCTVSF